MTRWEFVIPRALPSRNAEERNHFWRKKRSRDTWVRDLAIMRVHHRIPDATGKRSVTITRLMGKGQREYDADNVDVKTLLDAMKKASRTTSGSGLIRDDSPKWCDLTVNQERAADGKPGTRITIADMEPSE